MHRTIRVSVLVAIAGALVAFPVGASATTFTAPTTLNFGSQPVGTPGAPQTTTLAVQCTNYIGFPVDTCITSSFDALTVDIKKPADYLTTSNCPATLPVGPLTSPNVCEINVTFKPTKAGTRNGTLSTGTTGFLSPGPTVDLTGAGFDLPGQSGATKKKCKKKHKSSAQIAKKCKKKKK